MDRVFSKILDKNVNTIPNQLAFISEDEVISYLKFSNLISKIISNLEHIGIRSEHNVALRIKNPLRQFMLYFALLKMGVTQVAINLKDVVHVQRNVLSLIDITVVIQDIPLENSIHENSVYINENYSISERKINFKQKEDLINNDYAVVFNSSGTTSIPKVIAINNFVLAEQIILDTQSANYRRGETFYTHSDLSYVTSQRKIIAALYNGLSIYLPKQKPKDLFSFCKNNNIEHLFLTTSQVMMLISSKSKELERDNNVLKLSKVKSLMITSSMAVEPLRKKITNLITKNLYIAYGTNELGQVTIATPNDVITHIGTVGKLLPTISLRVVDNDGNDCKTGEVGNILVKTSNMIDGYLNNPEATKKAFTKDGFCPGDLGRLTEDGNLILEGRKDDMMIFSGVNIYPRELESLLESHPNVIESAVFPLTINNSAGIPFAVVVINEKIKERELIEWCHNQVGWRRPQRIFLTKKLPRNNAGKVLKRVLIEEVSKILKESVKN